jgi:hypothetical protein
MTNFGGNEQGKHRLICFTNAPREGLVFLKLCRRITKSPGALHNENRTERTLRFSLFRVREGVDWEVRKTKPLPRRRTSVGMSRENTGYLLYKCTWGGASFYDFLSPVALHNKNRTERTLRFSLFRVREDDVWEVRKTKPLPR